MSIARSLQCARWRQHARSQGLGSPHGGPQNACMNPCLALALRVLLSAIPTLLFVAPSFGAPSFGAPSASATAPNPPLLALADRYRDALVRFDPINAGTLAADHRYDDQLPTNLVPQARSAYFAGLRVLQRDLSRVATHRLPAADRLNHTLLARVLARELAAERFPDHLLPLQHMDAVPTVLAGLADGLGEQPLDTVPQLQAYLQRLQQLPGWVDQAIANMREGVRRGITQSRPVIEATLPQLKELAQAQPDTSAFAKPAQRAEALGQSELAKAYRQTVSEQVLPAMQRLAQFVQSEYLPAIQAGAVGWGRLPDGAAWYRQRVQRETTSNLTPDAIHALGLKEVARIQKLLPELSKALGYEGDAKDLLAWSERAPRFRVFKTEEEVLAHYRRLDAQVRMHLPKLFGRLPKMPLEIRPEPELTRATASDHYALGADDGSRPGVFWAVIPDATRQSLTTMTALFLHEGQPGHHLQLALQQEAPLPEFRKRDWVNAFGEGWALYAETLGYEMGLYDDPVARVGALRMELMRAARLVVDTGLHAKGWSHAQALAFWMAVTGDTEPDALSQINRYLAWPGQALGYKIGALTLERLRRQAQVQLGPRFKLADFHDEVLAQGVMPLSVLEQRLNRWIKACRATPGTKPCSESLGPAQF
jgi:uncharacterized protein (DUF885 family)